MFASALSVFALEIREDDRTIEVWETEKKMILRYHKKESPLPEGVPQLYRRSGYIHPVLSPDGSEVTGDFAPDHPHQHGLFMAWTSAKYGGRKIDFWNQRKEEGRVAHKRVIAKRSAPKRAEFVVELSHFDQRDGGREILREIWKVTVHLSGSDDYYVFDIDSEQSLVGDGPFVIEKYHYGGMAWRGNGAWLGKDACQFATSEGKDRSGGNHSRPNWVEMSGKIDGRFASVAILSHPKNFRAPQHVRIHPEKPYFCFAPMVEERFSITPKLPHVSRYRYLVSSKKVEKGWIDNQWKTFAAYFPNREMRTK